MKKIVCIFILCFLPAILLAEAESLTLTFSLENFTFTKQNTYDVINPLQNNDYIFTSEIGKPQLPVKIINLSIPQEKEISEIKIEPDVIDVNEKEMLEDLLLAAVNEALRQSKELAAQEMGKLTGGANIPGLF